MAEGGDSIDTGLKLTTDLLGMKSQLFDSESIVTPTCKEHGKNILTFV